MTLDREYRPDTYWPDGDREEPAQIVDVVLESVLGDTMHVLAEEQDGGSIRFRLVSGEGDDLVDLDWPPVPRPLSQAELIERMDSVVLGTGIGIGVVQSMLHLNSMVGSGDRENLDFLGVGSEFYPDIGEHYARVVEDLVMRGDAM